MLAGGSFLFGTLIGWLAIESIRQWRDGARAMACLLVAFVVFSSGCALAAIGSMVGMVKRILPALLALLLAVPAHAQLSIYNGGTGSRTIKGARDNLNVLSASEVTTIVTGSLLDYLKLSGRATDQIVLGQAATNIPLTARGHASQSTSIFVVEVNAGTDLFSVSQQGASLFTSTAAVPPITINGTSKDLLYVGQTGGGSLRFSNSATNGVAGSLVATGGAPSRLRFLGANGANHEIHLIGQTLQVKGTGDATTTPTSIVRRLVSQTAPLTSWQDESSVPLAWVTSAGRGWFTGLTLEDSTAGTNTITIRAPATPTTHSLLLPGANAAGSLTNDGAGTLSWSSTSSPSVHNHASPTQGGQHLKPWASHADSIPLVVTGTTSQLGDLARFVNTSGTVVSIPAGGGLDVVPASDQQGLHVTHDSGTAATSAIIVHDLAAALDAFLVTADGVTQTTGLSIGQGANIISIGSLATGVKTYFLQDVANSSRFTMQTSGSLTSGRVAFSTGTPGRLTDDADLTFATDELTATKMVASTSLKVGTGSAVTEIEKSLFNDFADAGNGTTVETDLYSHTIAANQLVANGDKLLARFSGLHVAHATATRQLKVYFAGTLIWDSTALTTTAGTNWDVEVTIIRESSTVVRCMTTMETTFPEGQTSSTYTRLTGLTLSGTNVLKITGQAGGVGAATNDIVAKLGYVQYAPA